MAAMLNRLRPICPHPGHHRATNAGKNRTAPVSVDFILSARCVTLKHDLFVRGGNMTIKAEAINAISELPDDSPLEDIMYHLYVLEKIHQGEGDVQEGRTMSSADLKKEASRW